MTSSTAFRFAHPVFDRAGGRMGMCLSVGGDLDTVSGSAAVRQAIVLLISTSPGERVMRPDYGCSLNRLVFAPCDDTTAGLAIHYVRTALQRWEPRIELRSVEARAEPGHAARLEIAVEYRVRASLDHERLVYSLPLSEPEP